MVFYRSGENALSKFEALKISDIPTGHPVERFLVYWEKIRGNEVCPLRDNFHPFDVAEVLPWLFLLVPDKDSPTGYMTKVCGSEIESLFGRNLTNLPYGDGLRGRDLHARVFEIEELKQTMAPCFSLAQNPLKERDFQFVYRGLFPFGRPSLTHLVAVMAPAKMSF